MMALPRRASREVYRVFSESDFMGGAEAGEVFPPAAGGEGSRQLRRIAGPVALAVVLLAIVAMLLAHRPPARPLGRPLPRAGTGLGVHLGKQGPQALAPAALAPGSDRRPDSFGRRVRLGPPAKPLPAVASALRGASRETHESSQGPVSRPENVEFGFER